MRFLLLFLLCSFALFGESNTSSSSIIKASQSVLSNIKTTQYNNKITIDEKNGTYILDCSSYVCFLLKKVSPLSLASLHVDTNHTHARAKNFYDFFHALEPMESKGGWIGIKRLSDVEAGDIIAWKYDPILMKKNTGHVVIVMEKPIKEKDGRYRVVVMDASKGKHANDTRAKETDGLGMGTMWFGTNENDIPIEIYWSDKTKIPSNHVIAMGRVIAK